MRAERERIDESPTALQLLYVPGCPNLEAARERIRAALARADEPLIWTEWDLTDAATPAEFRRYASPTVLVRGRDVLQGEDVGAITAGATACALGGAPSSSKIFERLRGDDLGPGPTRPFSTAIGRIPCPICQASFWLFSLASALVRKLRRRRAVP